MSLVDLLTGFFWLFLYMAPLAIVAGSKRCRGNEKTGWLLLTIVLSWIGLVAYFSTVLNKKERSERNREQFKRQQRAEAAAKRKHMQQQAAAEQAADTPEVVQNQQPPQAKGGNPNVEDSA